jgi:class 3 adenylate cyclase
MDSIMSKNSSDLEVEHLLKLSRLINRLKSPKITKTYLHETIIEGLNKKGDLTATEKLLTVVFWDIKDFSSLCDILKTHALHVPLLREFLELARNIICERSSILDKFLGDGVMAFFEFQNNDNNYTNDGVVSG